LAPCSFLNAFSAHNDKIPEAQELLAAPVSSPSYSCRLLACIATGVATKGFLPTQTVLAVEQRHLETMGIPEFLSRVLDSAGRPLDLRAFADGIPVPCGGSGGGNNNRSKKRPMRIGIDVSSWIYKAAHGFGDMLGDERHLTNYGRANLLEEQETSLLQEEHGNGAVAVQEYINACTQYVMKRLVTLRDTSKADCLVVLDGATPPCKTKEVQRRRETRQEHVRQRDEVVDINADEAANHRRTKAFKRAGAGRHYTTIVKQLLQELRVQLIPFMVAPYEADSQLAYMSHLDYIDLIITEDSDLIAHGAKAILYKSVAEIGNGQPKGILLQSSDIGSVSSLNLLDFSSVMLAVLFVSVGCDYCDKLKGIGLVTASRIVRKAFLEPRSREIHPSAIDVVLEELYKQSYTASFTDEFKQEYNQSFLAALLMYRHPVVYNPLARACVTVGLDEPDADLMDHLDYYKLVKDTNQRSLVVGIVPPAATATAMAEGQRFTSPNKTTTTTTTTTSLLCQSENDKSQQEKQDDIKEGDNEWPEDEEDDSQRALTQQEQPPRQGELSEDEEDDSQRALTQQEQPPRQGELSEDEEDDSQRALTQQEQPNHADYSALLRDEEGRNQVLGTVPPAAMATAVAQGRPVAALLLPGREGRPERDAPQADEQQKQPSQPDERKEEKESSSEDEDESQRAATQEEEIILDDNDDDMDVDDAIAGVDEQRQFDDADGDEEEEYQAPGTQTEETQDVIHLDDDDDDNDEDDDDDGMGHDTQDTWADFAASSTGNANPLDRIIPTASASAKPAATSPEVIDILDSSDDEAVGGLPRKISDCKVESASPNQDHEEDHEDEKPAKATADDDKDNNVLSQEATSPDVTFLTVGFVNFNQSQGSSSHDASMEARSPNLLASLTPEEQASTDVELV
jgi:5'-3' exonuclease